MFRIVRSWRERAEKGNEINYQEQEQGQEEEKETMDETDKKTAGQTLLLSPGEGGTGIPVPDIPLQDRGNSSRDDRERDRQELRGQGGQKEQGEQMAGTGSLGMGDPSGQSSDSGHSNAQQDENGRTTETGTDTDTESFAFGDEMRDKNNGEISEPDGDGVDDGDMQIGDTVDSVSTGDRNETGGKEEEDGYEADFFGDYDGDMDSDCSCSEYDEDCDGDYDEDYGEDHDGGYDGDDGDDYNYDDDEYAVGEYNTVETFDPFEFKTEINEQQLANTFARLIAMIAEDITGPPVPGGDDEWDMGALIARRFDRRPLWSCRVGRERLGVVLLLDTSGSCAWQAEFYAKIARIACRHNDVEMYTVPNGWIERKYNPCTGKWETVDIMQDDKWPFKNRVILFFGDFDGGDYVVLGSRENEVYWFSCEDRYEDMDEHSWCSYALNDFKGKYFDCFDALDFINAVKKIRPVTARL